MGSFAASQLSVIVAPVLAAVANGTLSSNGPYRPTQWTTPALTAISVPNTAPAGPPSVVNNFDGTPMPGAEAFNGPATIYVFDAVPRVDHSRELRRTENPIQVSASSPVGSVCDHAILLPARVVLEIGMSDAMASYIPGSWTSNKSKSISAYETLIQLHEARTLFTLTTRLATYTNMLVEAVRAPDSVETRWGLKATVVFSRIATAMGTAVSTRLLTGSDMQTGPATSARPNATGSTPQGTTQPTPPTAALTAQNKVLINTIVTNALPRVPGSGTWSSINIGRLGGLPG